ncbi:MAG TPA: hypothetical protein VEJ63_02810 [Planctomycetota bacterium]|nr:hypothetical protein [Planctomycetota bacterium]
MRQSLSPKPGVRLCSLAYASGFHFVCAIILGLFASAALAAAEADNDIRAEIVELPPLPEEPKPAPLKKAVIDSKSLQQPVVPKAPAADAGFRVVLKGPLTRNTELKQSDSPVLIKGNVVIPAGCTLKIGPGTVVTLQGDETAPAPQNGAPDARVGGVLWVWGTLSIEGVTGNPVEVSAKSGNDGSLLFFGGETSRIEGARFKNIAMTQTAGTVHWLNCEIVNAKHYALATGVATLTHCSLKSCGGLFASYTVGPWSLLVRRSLFENCKEGIILGSDPGETRLILERNHFIGTKGAHLRVLPTNATRVEARRVSEGQAGRTPTGLDIFIGENWYGTAAADEVDLRLIDRRADMSLRARLNIRPPAEKPYTDTGAGISAAAISATQKEQEPILKRLLAAHPFPKPKAEAAGTQTASATKPAPAGPKQEKEKSDKSSAAPMSKAVKRSDK